MANEHPDRAGDGQDEVRLVAMTAAQRRSLRGLAVYNDTIPEESRAKLYALTDSFEDGITEEEVERIRDAYFDGDPDALFDAEGIIHRLAAAFPTQKDSGDG